MHRYLVFLLDEIYLKNVYYLPKSIFYKQLWSIVFLKVPPGSLLKPDRQKNLEVDRATDVFFYGRILLLLLVTKSGVRDGAALNAVISRSAAKINHRILSNL